MKKMLLLFCLLISIATRAEEKRIITSDGVELFVNIKGSGTPCLYIHGGPGSGSYWFEKFFGQFMEEHFTMIYLDQRGVGRSTSPEDGNFSMDRMSKDFEEVRKNLNIKKWLTIGHSFGGIIQMGYTERYPDSQLGMIMIDCTLNLKESFYESWAPKAAEFIGEEYSGCKNDSIPLMQRLSDLGNKLREKDLFWKMGFSNKEDQTQLDETYNNFPDWNYDFGQASLDIQDYWKNFKPDTRAINIPVLYYIGKDDYMVGADHYKGVNFPNMMLVRKEGGHLPMIDHQDELEEAILEYIQKYQF